MTFSRTDRARGWGLLGASALVLLLAGGPGCSFTDRERLAERAVGVVVMEGFDEADQRFLLAGNRYWQAVAEGSEVVVTNTPLGAGVSPVWFQGDPPNDFEVRVRATIDKEGLDGGWGVEFGAQDRKYGYRALVYASGRFCLDRLFGLYPEFIHCIPTQPEIHRGDARNVLSIRVQGDKISVAINGDEVVVFTDDRYEPGELALAVAGAGTRVIFDDIVVLSLE